MAANPLVYKGSETPAHGKIGAESDPALRQQPGSWPDSLEESDMTNDTANQGAPYSPPRVGVTKYTIYPTGYDQSPFSDTGHFCVYVEQYPDTGRWRVHDGFPRNLVASRTGRWIYDTPLNRQWTRFDSPEDAIEVALVAVDTRQGRNLVEWIESPRGQQIAREVSA